MSKQEESTKKLTFSERLLSFLRNRSKKEKEQLEDLQKANEEYRKWLEQNKQTSIEQASTESKEEQKEEWDPSIYEPDNPNATQEDDMEEDLALLDEEDDLW